MKKIILFIGITVVSFSSCTNQLDRTDPLSVAEYVHNSFNKGNLSNIYALYENGEESIKSDELDDINEIVAFYSKNIKVIKTDTLANNLFGLKYRYLIYIYYQLNDDFFRLSASYDYNRDNEIYLRTFSLINLNSKCEEDKQRVFCPSALIRFQKVNWTASDFGETFEHAEIEVKNGLNKDINYLKFRVKVAKGQVFDESLVFFNQTIVSNKIIYSGDIGIIDIPELNDYYVGFKINNRNLNFSVELIDVGPKPKSVYCNAVEELKQIVLQF